MKNVNDKLFAGLKASSIAEKALENIYGGHNSQSTGDCQATGWSGPDCTDVDTGARHDSITSGAEFDR